MVEGEPSERAATTGPSSLSPSSWYCSGVSNEDEQNGAKKTYVDFVRFHVPQREKFVELPSLGNDGILANKALIQGADECIGEADAQLPGPHQAMEAFQDDVRCF
jgi:hypothetical protein